MRVIWLSVVFYSVKFTSARYIPSRRLDSDKPPPPPPPPAPEEPVTEEQILYDNLNILRDLTLTTEGIWDFEEVDYDAMEGVIKTEHNDCFGISISCTLAMGHIRPVCGVHNNRQKGPTEQNYIYMYVEKFANVCDMDYRNCLNRIFSKEQSNPSGVFGTGNNDYLEWTAEGYKCADQDKYRPAGK